MNALSPRLWIGDANDGRNVDEVRRNGIVTILNATSETDNLGDWKNDPGHFYRRLNQNDGAVIPDATLADAEAFLVSTPGPKLIHCGAGVSRAATFTIFYLMLAGLGWDDAEAVVKKYRPQINPHPLLKQSVLQYFERWPRGAV